MKTLKLIPLAFLGLVLLAACQHKEEPVSGNQNITIKASIGSMTKVAYDGVATAFTAGDVLAVYAWTGSNSTVPSEKVVDGVRNTLGDDGKWTPATPMVWADATTDHYFIGVSPARDVSDFTQDSFTLDPSDYTASDLLIANTPNGIKPTDQPVDLSFDHMMAKLNVNLRFRSQWETTPTVSSITVTAKTSATVNYLTKAVTATGDATAIPLFAGSSALEGYVLSYSCLIIPQSGVNTVIITIDGKEYQYSAEEEIPLISGKITHLFIAVGEDKKDPISLECGSMSVVDWDEGESLAEGDALFIPKMVDLGLSIKWAECNLGASSPEKYGDYYAWGETETKSYYSWSTYKFGTSSSGPFSKYNTKESFGPVDNKTVLDPEDDVVHIRFGGKWRMPTDAEWTELLTQCSLVWTDDYNGKGVKGVIVTAANDNTVFLPATGGFGGTGLVDNGVHGYYWSSTLDPVNPQIANGIGLFSDWREWGITVTDRYAGRAIRPIYEE